MLIKTLNDYFYEKRRDLIVLQIKYKPEGRIFIDRDDEKFKEISKNHLEWFEQRGIKMFRTVPPEIIMGWAGHYYVDIDPKDPILIEYSKEFEDETGVSISPDDYQLYNIFYSEWLKNNGIEKYEQHLKDLENPDYEI